MEIYREDISEWLTALFADDDVEPIDKVGFLMQ
jgi:hypothetical protein